MAPRATPMTALLVCSVTPRYGPTSRRPTTSSTRTAPAERKTAIAATRSGSRRRRIVAGAMPGSGRPVSTRQRLTDCRVIATQANGSIRYDLTVAMTFSRADVVLGFHSVGVQVDASYVIDTNPFSHIEAWFGLSLTNANSFLRLERRCCVGAFASS